MVTIVLPTKRGPYTDQFYIKIQHDDVTTAYLIGVVKSVDIDPSLKQYCVKVEDPKANTTAIVWADAVTVQTA